jgi:hypothetical protein
MSFTQKAWMKKYIDFNTDKRAKSTTEFEKDFYKFMINAPYGKSMENVDKQTNVKILVDNQVKTEEEMKRQVDKLTGSVLFDSMKIVNDNFVMVKSRKTTITYDKPIMVGFTILELSKLCMFQFYYEYMLPKYGIDKLKLLFTDTDSFCFEIQTDDFFKDIEGDKELFDLTNFKETVTYNNNEKGMTDYNKEKPLITKYCEKHNIQMTETVNKDGSVSITTIHPLYDNTNNKRIINSRNGFGVMKVETSFHPMTEFVGLRSKLYSYTKETYDGIKHDLRAKGIKKSVAKYSLSQQDYIDVLNQTKHLKKITQRGFRTKNHNISTIEQEKVGLSAFDDKRFICENGIDTFAWGHVDINPNDIISY